jgi:hypothetical protein
MKIFTKMLCGAALLVVGQKASAQTLIENFENTRLVEYVSKEGTLVENAAIPANSTGNSSAKCASFVRNLNTPYATIAFALKNGGKFADVTPYISGAKKMTVKFLSPGPGTKVQFVFQDHSKVAYPKGNYAGDFFATTTAAANVWETLTFAFQAGAANGIDATVKPVDIDQIAFLITPGVTATATNNPTFYYDDIMGPELATTATATRTSLQGVAAFAPAYPNPATSATKLPYSLNKAATVNLAVFDNMGRRVAQVVSSQRQPAGQFVADLNTSRLAPGLYTCRLTVDGVALTRQLSVQ